MPFISPEAFGVFDAGTGSAGARPGLHHFQIVVDTVMFEQPLPLAGVLCEHGGFGFHLRGHVYEEIGLDGAPVAIHAADGVHEIQMWNGADRGRGVGGAGCVDGGGGAETGVADKQAGGLVIAEVIDRGRGKNQVRGSLAQDLANTAAGRVVNKNAEIAELPAAIIGTDVRRGPSGLSAPDARDLFPGVVGGAAIAGRHGNDGEPVPGGGKQRESSCGENLDVIGMGMDSENVFFHEGRVGRSG